jgi:signal transduction histidine kinase
MDDILDTQKFQNDNFEFKYSIVNLCNTVKRVQTVIENKAKEKNIELIITGNCDKLERCLYADERRISQIFVNILNNAIKYTKSNGKIFWDIKFNKINNHKVVIFTKIRDTGVGMTEDFINKNLFKPFSKEINSLSKSEGGTGLGLTISKELIELLGGEIEFESKVDKGSTFYFELEFYKDYITYQQWRLENGKISKGKFSLLKISEPEYLKFIKRLEEEELFNEKVVEIIRVETRDSKINEIISSNTDKEMDNFFDEFDI